MLSNNDEKIDFLVSEIEVSYSGFYINIDCKYQDIYTLESLVEHNEWKVKRN